MGAKVSDLVQIMEEIAPTTLAESWDNSGLQVGHMAYSVRKVMVSLDPELEVVRHAAESSVDMLICHHPLLFRPLKQIDLSSTIGEIVGIAIRNDIALYAAHTNYDSAIGGLNDELACRIGLHDIKALVSNETADTGKEAGVTGLGRIGTIYGEFTLDSFCRTLKKTLGIETVRMTGDKNMAVKQVALCSGSGGSLLDTFFNSDADVFITGDVGYHDALEVRSRGRAIIDIGHFGSEHIMVHQMGTRLKDILGKKHPDVHVVMCEMEKDPFVTI